MIRRNHSTRHKLAPAPTPLVKALKVKPIGRLEHVHYDPKTGRKRPKDHKGTHPGSR